MCSLLVRAAAAIGVLSRQAAGIRSVVDVYAALDANAGAQAAESASRSGPPDMRTVVETILHDPPNVMDPNATQDVLNYCLDAGFKCDRAIEWRRQCYDVMGDPIARGPKAEGKKKEKKNGRKPGGEGSRRRRKDGEPGSKEKEGGSGRRRKGRKPEAICEEDPVYLDVEGALQAACKKAFVCVDEPSRTFVAGRDGRKVGSSKRHCDGLPQAKTYRACVPDWQPDGQDALRNPLDVVSALPVVKLPPQVEEVISEFIPFFSADWFPTPTPVLAGGEEAATQTGTANLSTAEDDSTDRMARGGQRQAKMQDVRCICNDDATKAVLLLTQDRLTGKVLFVGSSGLRMGHAPKIALGSASPCACLQKFHDRRPWSLFAPKNQCTDAPTFWDPVTESTQIWLREKARRPFADVTWFEDCLALCRDPAGLPHVDTACAVADA